MAYLIIIAVAAVIVVVSITIKYLPLMVRVFLNVRVASPNKFGAPEGEEVNFKSLDGIDLKGFFIKSSSGGGRTVIFLSGIRGLKSTGPTSCRDRPTAGAARAARPVAARTC